MTALATIPSVFRTIFNAASAQPHPPLDTMRIVRLSSEPVLAVDLLLFKRSFSPGCAILVNSYGATEVGAVTRFIADHHTQIEGAVLPIGKPLEGLTVLITDSTLNPLPVGEIGEIVVRTRRSQAAYWNDPEQSASKFVTLPDNPKALLYRTGDLGRMLPDGNLVLIGRADSMVKIRGFRVELNPIENQLRLHPNIQDATLKAVSNSTGENARLIAYIVPRAGGTLGIGNLRSYLADSLPDYMIPAQFIFVDFLPTLPGGKVDKSALPLPADAWQPEEGPDSRLSPRDDLEQTIASIWVEAFAENGHSTVGIHDNFFDLGGHSLLAIQIVSRLRQVLGKPIPLATFFLSPTIAGIADFIRSRQPIKSEDYLIPIQPEGQRPPLFCMPPVNGGVFSYRTLIEYLGKNQPIYALQSRGMDGEAEPFSTMDEMVTAFLKDISSIQPHGPYFLCGYSFGGRVAIEVARSLQDRGEKVAFLGLIATVFKYQTIKLAGRPRTLRWKLSTAWFTASRVPHRYWLKYVKDWFYMNLNFNKTEQVRKVPTYYTDAISKVRVANGAISRNSEFRPYFNPITYFFAKDDRFSVEIFKDLDLIAKGTLEIIDVPGRHQTVMEAENVATMGMMIRERLDRLNSPNLDSSKESSSV